MQVVTLLSRTGLVVVQEAMIGFWPEGEASDCFEEADERVRKLTYHRWKVRVCRALCTRGSIPSPSRG